MDKISRYFTLTALLLLFQTQGMTYVHGAELVVQASVEPYVLVTTSNPDVDLGAMSTNSLHGNFWFSIESNSSRVALQAVVTHLYKDGNPNLPSLVVDTSSGVRFRPDAATAINGSSLNADFVSTQTVSKPNGLFDGHQSAQVDLEASKGDFFDQDVELSVGWMRGGGQKIMPAGTYNGYIILNVAVLQ